MDIDAIEDSWWPSSVTSSRPFTLPTSSQWLHTQDGKFLIIQVGGDSFQYVTNPNFLPFSMLLDIVQMTYLHLSNSSDVDEQEIFYKGVVFLDNLRQHFLDSIRKAHPYCETEKALVPESMQRWICRMLRSIPHDPLNRKLHVEILNRDYLEIDVLNYGLCPSILHERNLIFKLWSRFFGLVTHP
jgi:hypothetical protein